MRRAVLVGVLAATAVAVFSAPGLESVSVALADGSAWLMRGTGIAHASSSSGEADWLEPNVVGEDAVGQTRVSQDGDLTLVVDPVGGRGYSIDAVTLQLGEPMAVDASAVPLVGGGRAYLVSDGAVRWLDAETFETKRTIRLPGRVRAAIDDRGVLWAATSRDGMLRRIVRGRVTHEARVSSPGHSLEVTLAGRRPVVRDVASGELWFVERRTVELGEPVEVPEGSVLQGPSPHGERVWLATTDGVLGVRADGDVVEVRRPDGGLPHRPEVIEGRVIVPTREGTVTVLEEPSGRLVTDEPKPLMPAARDDFSTFVKDGVLWFNAPQQQIAGTVAPDGQVELIAVDEEGLRTRRESRPETGPPVNPNQVVSPATAPAPTSRPSTADAPPAAGPQVPPTQVQPAPPPPLPTQQPPATVTTTTTTQPTTTGPQSVAVPPVANQNVDQACNTLRQQGLDCRRRPSGQYAEPAQVVLSQSPVQGTQVARGTLVDVTYHESAGVVVPDVGDRWGNSTCAPITRAGLRCNPVPSPSPEPIEPAGVWDQNPQPGTRVGPGSTVNVTYDNRAWGTVYQFDDPGSFRLILSTDANAAPGWTQTTLGRIFLEQAPGTVPYYCWEPNGIGQNLGNSYNLTGDDDLDGYHRRCADSVLGYGLGQEHRGDYGIIYAYVAHSDFYYSTSDSDPTGQSEYLAVGGSYSGPIFHLYAE